MSKSLRGDFPFLSKVGRLIRRIEEGFGPCSVALYVAFSSRTVVCTVKFP
jgi:hypothetical protein